MERKNKVKLHKIKIEINKKFIFVYFYLIKIYSIKIKIFGNLERYNILLSNSFRNLEWIFSLFYSFLILILHNKIRINIFMLINEHFSIIILF